MGHSRGAGGGHGAGGDFGPLRAEVAGVSRVAAGGQERRQPHLCASGARTGSGRRPGRGSARAIPLPAAGDGADRGRSRAPGAAGGAGGESRSGDRRAEMVGSGGEIPHLGTVIGVAAAIAGRGWLVFSWLRVISRCAARKLQPMLAAAAKRAQQRHGLTAPGRPAEHFSSKEEKCSDWRYTHTDKQLAAIAGSSLATVFRLRQPGQGAGALQSSRARPQRSAGGMVLQLCGRRLPEALLSEVACWRRMAQKRAIRTHFLRMARKGAARLPRRPRACGLHPNVKRPPPAAASGGRVK